MNARDLIAALEKLDPETEIYVWDSTWGGEIAQEVSQRNAGYSQDRRYFIH